MASIAKNAYRWYTILYEDISNVLVSFYKNLLNVAQNEQNKQFHALGIALEMGYFIALPLVGFAILGAFLDSTFKTKPLILLISILFAIVISTVLVYRKTKEILDDTSNSPSDKKEL
ncbi:MAG: AtpZ/AtpI family protein [Patescibacteria group bacterium]